MISPDKAAVPLPWANKITFIDLVQRTVGETKFNFMGQVMVELYLFKEPICFVLTSQLLGCSLLNRGKSKFHTSTSKT